LPPSASASFSEYCGVGGFLPVPRRASVIAPGLLRHDEEAFAISLSDRGKIFCCRSYKLYSNCTS
jgi:hypothetical protein